MTFVQTIDLSIWNVKRFNPRLEHWGLLYVNNQEVGASHCSGRNLKRLTLLRSGLRWRDTGSQWDLWQSWRACHHGFAKVTGSKHWILLASWEGHVSNSGLITYPVHRSNPPFSEFKQNCSYVILLKSTNHDHWYSVIHSTLKLNMDVIFVFQVLTLFKKLELGDVTREMSSSEVAGRNSVHD